MPRALPSPLRTATPATLARDAVCLALIAASLLLHWRAIADVWLVGPDLFHLLEASRLGEGRGVLDVATSKFQPFLNFYRPLTSLTFSLDQWLWDLDAVGFQITNLACYAFCLVAFWLFGARLVCSGRRGGHLGLVVAVALFAFLPVVWDVLPWTERRTEFLMLGFALLALRAQLDPRAYGGRGMPLAPVLWSLLAMCSKDASLALVPIYFVAALVAVPTDGVLGRGLRAARAMVPHLVVAVGFFLVRLTVVDGMGGDEATSSANLVRLPILVVDLLAALIVPNAPVEAGLAFGWSLILCVLLAFLALVPWPRALGAEVPAREPNAGDAVALRAWVVLLPWFAVFVGLYCLRGFITPWYVLAPAVAWCLLVGVLANALLARALDGPWVQRGLAVAALVALAVGAWLQGARSPIFTGDPHVEGISERERAFFAELERYILESPPGTELPAPTIDLRYRSDVIKWVELMDFERPVGVFRDAEEAARLGTEGLEVLVYYVNDNER